MAGETIKIDSNGAKIGWILLAVIFGAFATAYANNMLNKSEKYAREQCEPVKDRVSELETSHKIMLIKLQNMSEDIDDLEVTP